MMIRKAREKYHDKIMDFLMAEPEINLFIIGDIENHGYKHRNLDIWIDLVREKIQGILIRYYGSLILYARDNFNIKGMARRIRFSGCDYLSGKEDVILKIEKYIGFRDKKSFNICVLKSGTYKERYDDEGEIIKPLTTVDIDAFIKLRDSIEEFREPPNRDMTLSNLKNKFSRAYFIEKQNKMVSVVQTTAECSFAAMVVGVCTDSEYRGKGYASKCMQKLCREILNEGKNLCLFYENPVAARIYKSIGFKDIGKWRMDVR